jgi:hypothetical protein
MMEGLKCPNETNRTLPLESFKENIERSLVFFKKLHDGGFPGALAFMSDPQAIKQVALPSPEREEFIAAWRDVIRRTPKGDSPVKQSIMYFFRLGRPGNSERVLESVETDIDRVFMEFTQAEKPVPAHECEKRGLPSQTLFARFVSLIRYDEYIWNYLINEEANVDACRTYPLARSIPRPDRAIFDELCYIMCADITVENPLVNVATGEWESDTELRDSLYVQLKEWPFPATKAKVPYRMAKIAQNQFMKDSIAADNIRDIHPRLMYYLWLHEYEFISAMFDGRHDCDGFRYVAPLQGRENLLLKNARAAPIPVDERQFFQGRVGPLRVKYEGQHPYYKLYAAYGKETDILRMEQRSIVKYRVPLTEDESLQRNREMHAWYFALSWLVTRSPVFVAADFYSKPFKQKLMVFFQIDTKKPQIFERAGEFVKWAVGRAPEFVTRGNVLPLMEYLSEEGWSGPSGQIPRPRGGGGRRQSRLSNTTLKNKKRGRKSLKRKN